MTQEIPGSMMPKQPLPNPDNGSRPRIQGVERGDPRNHWTKAAPRRRKGWHPPPFREEPFALPEGLPAPVGRGQSNIGLLQLRLCIPEIRNGPAAATESGPGGSLFPNESGLGREPRAQPPGRAFRAAAHCPLLSHKGGIQTHGLAAGWTATAILVMKLCLKSRASLLYLL